MPTDDLNVSLEPHLLDVLRPLASLLPPPINDQLQSSISGDTIPVSLLRAISQWSSSPDGKDRLRAHDQSLNPSSYSMVSLLAGVKTSPERKFGTYNPPSEPEELAQRQKRERKEITALLNALLSIFAAGFAVWWAADLLYWKPQWRVLLALATSLVVAIAEGGLFIIWRSRLPSSHKSRQRSIQARHKKNDDSDDTNAANSTTDLELKMEPTRSAPVPITSNLRQRKL
ncbi:hypothetical protein Agabi119p4_6463 [Agaricus bisporus var. burnettii]|uniref:Endoplasmic reticulum-based factor for assembly of V-ATPase-domain-containing protein n=1 Tax=Agaricus bisporus var. burnettii TaxID=192524 RepID=A0A8H7C8N8_AGABI|nr:hypothetical protein Agabi119p4_6463 [Agaricus bisporus var. burnettii]